MITKPSWLKPGSSLTAGTLWGSWPGQPKGGKTVNIQNLFQTGIAENRSLVYLTGRS